MERTSKGREFNKILLISGYHPKETFAVRVGEYFLQNKLNCDAKVIRYVGKPDQISSRNLKRFIGKFGSGSEIVPIVLHGDDDIGVDAVIICYARSKLEKKKSLKILFDFSLECYHSNGIKVVGDIVFVPTAKYNLIEIELNSRMGLFKGVSLIRNFCEYLRKSF